MALKTAGVILEAQNAAQYYAELTKANQATTAFTQGLTTGARAATLEAQRLQGQMAALSNTIGIQTRQANLLQAELEQTKQKYGESSMQAQKKQLILDRLQGSIAANTQRLGQYGQQLAATTQQSGAFTASLAKMADGAKMYLGAMLTNYALQAGNAFKQFIKDSVDAAGKFESSLNRFGAIAGSSSAEIKQMSKLFLQLGKDTQYSAQQAAEAAINLAKGGITPAAIASGALADTLALAAAGELDLAVAAEVAAKQLGVWANVGVTSADVANLMSQAANASTVGVQDLALGMANVGDVAKIAGLSFRETVTTMAMIAPGFSGAADAGTSFKTFLTALTPKTDAATDAFKRLGLMTEDGKNKFYDASGSFVGMSQASQLLASATANLTEEQKKQLLATAFGTDAIRTAARIAENGAAGYQAMTASMENAGSATDQAVKRQEGYNFATEQLSGSLETLQITIGQKLTPALTDFVQGLTIAANKTITFVEVLSGLLGMNDDIATLAENGKSIGVGFDRFGKNAEAAGKSGAKLTRLLQLLDESAPESASAIRSVSSEFITLDAAGGAWSQRANELMMQFRQTGDVNAFTTSIRAMAASYESAQLAVGTEGGGFSASLQALQFGMTSTISATDGMTDAAMRYATGVIGASQATGQLSAGIDPLSEQYEALKKTLEEVGTEGEKTVAKIAQSQIRYTMESEAAQSEHHTAMALLQEQYNSATTEKERQRVADLIKEEQAGYDEQARQRAAAYGAERMAQQAHLGELLIQHFIAWGRMNGISAERIKEITGEVATKYGVAKNSVVLSFAEMTEKGEQWMKGTEQSADGAVQGMLDAQNAATTTEQRMAQIRAEQKAALDTQLAEHKITNDQYIAMLAEIPTKVETQYQLEIKQQELMDSANEARAMASAKGVEIGTALAEGMAKGIVDNDKVVAAAAAAAVDHSYEAARWQAGIHSPSQLFADGIGMPLAEGIAEGFTRGMVNSAAAMSGALDKVGRGLGEQARRTSQAVRDAMIAGIGGILEAGGGAGPGLSSGISFSGLQGFASGGPVAAGRPIWVGERGKELFVPRQDGAILPHQQAVALAARPSQIANSYSTSTSTSTSYHYAPTYGGTPPAPSYDFAMMEARAQ